MCRAGTRTPKPMQGPTTAETGTEDQSVAGALGPCFSHSRRPTVLNLPELELSTVGVSRGTPIARLVLGRRRPARKIKERTRSWIWNVGCEMRKVDILKNINDAAMTHYIIDVGFGTIAKDLLPTQSTFQIAGASAAEREERCPGSGELPVQLSGRRYRAILDGWAFYSQTPLALMSEINQLAFEYEV